MRAELEREKIEVTNLREELLQSTIKLTLELKEKKVTFLFNLDRPL